MSELVNYNSDYMETMEEIASLSMRGEGLYAIAKKVSMRPIDVKAALKEYKEIIRNDSESREMAKDHLFQMVEHFDTLIKEYYELLAGVKELTLNPSVAAQINGAIKGIADLEARRLDLLQKAGLLEGDEMEFEIERLSQQRDIIVSILKEDLCAECTMAVQYKLSQVTGEHAEHVVDAEVVEE